MSLLPFGHQSGTYVKAPLGQVAECLVRWGNEEHVGRSTAACQLKMDLERAWKLLDEQRPASANRAILVSMAGGQTAFFDNQLYEFPPGAQMFVLCKRLTVDTYFFSYSDGSKGQDAESAQFAAYRFRNGAAEQRMVMVTKEGGWKFHQFGEALPFERLERYQAKKKRDRRTADLLREYGEAAGFRFWDLAAYRDEVIELRWKGQAEQLGRDNALVLKTVREILGEPKMVIEGRGGAAGEKHEP